MSLPLLHSVAMRAIVAAIIGLVLTLLWGRRWIDWLRTRFREPIKGDSARLCELQQSKSATPTMGGLFIVAGLVVGVALCGDLGNRYLQIAVLLAIGLGAVGAVDDLVKLHRKSKGLSARVKLACQTLVCGVAAMLVYEYQAALPDGLALDVPLLGVRIAMGAAFVPWAMLVMVGASNAVNLTDGLDGLAGGCMVVVVAAMALGAWIAPQAAGASEMIVLAGAMVGVLAGFLRFNWHPAQVFMGDTGSLPLGGLLGLLAVATRQELLLAVVGGAFVAEALSVILQVGYYKWRRRRIFLCAPLHHHFQFQGWPETRVVVRFWLASALFALLGLSTLMISAGQRAAASHDATTAMESLVQR